MINAYISGQAGLAIILNDSLITCLRLDQDGPPEIISQGIIPRLLEYCTDIIKLENTTEKQIETELELAWTKDRALHLFLIMIDEHESIELRTEAMELIKELLESLESIQNDKI